MAIQKTVGKNRGSVPNYLLFFCALFLMVNPSAYAQQPSGPTFSTAPIPSQAPDASQVVGPKATSPGIPSSIQQLTPQQADALQKLSPAQQQVIQQELGKTGGQLTPQAVEALKGRQEFKGLSPEDVAKGKQLLEQREKAPENGLEKKEAEKVEKKDAEKVEKKEPPWAEKTVIGGGAVEDSLFERSRRVGKYQAVSLDLRLFGSEFFRDAAVRVITDRKDIPVPLKYVVGPGDEVKLLLWGRLNAQYNLTVDRDGKITIPQVGPIFVAGMTFEEMSKNLISQATQIVGTNIDISMGSLKTISIFMLGDVRRPGSYTIGSFATITDALMMAGGPSDIGSMRRVQVKRKDKLLTTFDLYDLLLKGDKSKDIVLQAGDVIFVPVTGLQVGIAGNVKRPAIYELKDHPNLEYLVECAGGIIPTAYTQQIQVERIVKGEKHVVVDINDKNMERAIQFHLQDADLVKVFSIVDANVNAIYLNGNVKRPGKYEYKIGLTLKDLISKPDELLPETYMDYALIKRLKPPSMEPFLIPFNLGKFIFHQDPASNVALQPQDQIFIFSKWFFKDKPQFTISGEVRKGGRFDLTENIHIKDAILAAGDLTKDAYLKKGELIRVNKLREYQTIYFNVAKAQAGDAQENILLKDEDQIVIHSMWEEKWREVAAISGEVKNPLETPLMESMRVSELVFKAGGVTRDTYLVQAELYRTDWRTKEVTLKSLDLGKALAGDPRHNLLLKDMDRLVVHSVWEKIFKKTVHIDGDVHKPGAYPFAEDMTVRDLVFTAGNVQESVYLGEAEIASMTVDGGKTAKISVKNFNLRKALDGDPEHNIKLKPYDRVMIKRITDWRREEFVTVSGQIKFPGRYAVRKDEKLSELIERAGGYTAEAYLRGTVFKRESVRAVQQEGLEEMARRMERDLLAQGAMRMSTSLTEAEVRSKEAELVQKQRLIETMKQLKATGRMTIRLANLRLLKGSEYDIELDNGDSLFIPQKNSVVNVMGAVMSQASYVYLDRFTYKDYINMAGGYSSYADESETFVLKVDGSARRLDRGALAWNNKSDRWEMSAFSQDIPAIESGDTIIVPEKMESIAWLRELRDITQILMNAAVVAGVVIKLF
ncbi:MAG: SLBB domain-containing protein [Syntrophales bacterium]|nr:SLBB domain-containing protein [Syntrophales bacterium]